jgi:peroxiredoxin family protein
MHIPTLIGALPGMSWIATKMMGSQLEELDIPPIGEFLELIHDSGGRIYACHASVEMFDLEKDDFVPQVDGVLTVGEFYELSAGAQVIFT